MVCERMGVLKRVWGGGPGTLTPATVGALHWPRGHGDSTTLCAFQAALLLGPFIRQRVTLRLPPVTCMAALLPSSFT